MCGDEQKCRKAGCTGYVSKPIDHNALLVAIANALRDGCQSSPVQPDASVGDPGDSAPISCSLPMDDQDFREIASAFVERLKIKIAEMRFAAAEMDFRELSQLAHWLKGTAGTAGFNALTSVATVLERAAKESDLAAVTRSLDQLDRLSARLVDPSESCMRPTS
jgi:HPt (histidine-containing phosphotransfer) domain-containing protein